MNDVEIEWLTRIHDVMQSDDWHAAAEVCIRRQAYELRVLEQSCKHYHGQRIEAERLLEIAQRRTAYLAKKIHHLETTR